MNPRSLLRTAVLNMAALRVWVSGVLQIHRGEESRAIAFFLLHFVLSVVIGMISTVVDPLVVQGGTSSESIILYSVAALVLLALGLVYAGITDRIDKRRLFGYSLMASSGFCFFIGLLLLFHDYVLDLPPFVYTLFVWLFVSLFVWRFVMGIILLLIFWDLAPFYFNGRQGKRIFPLLATGGAVGYSSGALLVVPLSYFLPLSLRFFVIAFVTLLGFFMLQYIRGRYLLLDSPRYRHSSVRAEIQEGVHSLLANGFLRAVAWNTFIFGMVAGLIILSYNSIVGERVQAGTATAGVMGVQRAGATMLQAVVLTKVMSQSAFGSSHTKALTKQLFFFTLGVVAFAVSMVGVADFTRQIEIALMSPAAMAAFAFLPSQYRGRVMVLNNIVVASLGILAGSMLVLVFSPFVDALWFIYPIAVLMLLRLVLSFVLNRRYVMLLSESLVSNNRLNLKRLEENTASILTDPELLGRLLHVAKSQTPSTQVYVVGRLAESARTIEDIARIEPFFGIAGADRPELAALRIECLARVDVEHYSSEIAQATSSIHADVQVAARLALLQSRYQHDEFQAFATEKERLLAEFGRGAASDPEEYRELCELLLRFEAATEYAIISVNWNNMNRISQDIFVSVLAEHPSTHHCALLLQLIHMESFAALAVKGLKGLPEQFLLTKTTELSELTATERLRILLDLGETHPTLTRYLAETQLEEILSSREPAWTLLHQSGEAIRVTALRVLSGTTGIPATLQNLAASTVKVLSELFADLLHLRYISLPGEGSRYRPLLIKLIDEQLRQLAVLILVLNSLLPANEKRRTSSYAICSELDDHHTPLRHSALEFIETSVENPTKKYILVFFESLTEAEKRARLRPILRKRTTDARRTLHALHAQFSAQGSDVAREITATYT